MAKAVRVFIGRKSDNRGVSGVNVHFYGGEKVRTNSQGFADFIIEKSGAISFYANGTEIWKGSVYSMPKIITHYKS